MKRSNVKDVDTYIANIATGIPEEEITALIRKQAKIIEKI